MQSSWTRIINIGNIGTTSLNIKEQSMQWIKTAAFEKNIYIYQYKHFLRKTTSRDQNWMLTKLNFLRWQMTDNNFSLGRREREREYPIRESFQLKIQADKLIY